MVTLLQDYAKAKGLEPIEFDIVSAETLGNLLERFYADARTKSGGKYRRDSLLAARGAKNRHIKNSHRKRSRQNRNGCYSEFHAFTAIIRHIYIYIYID